MAKDFRTVPNNVVLPYAWALGKTWTRFFDGLKEEKIWGTKCGTCKNVYVPARSFCPECLKDMKDWVQVKDEGTVISWTLVKGKYYAQVKKPPYIIGLIRLDGADSFFIHNIEGYDLSDIKKVTKGLKKGTKVKAVWRPEKKADIHDIVCFAPVK